MKEQLSKARKRSWCYAGVIPLGSDQWGETESINERRCFEGLRFASDIESLTVKPPAISWIDARGAARTYSPDARAHLAGGEKAYIEIKPRGVLARASKTRTKYEEIGGFLQSQGKWRFGLMEWSWDGIFERNVSLLSRYWNCEPSNIAVKTFEAIGNAEIMLAQLFDGTGWEHRREIWAALAKQQLTADLHAGPLGAHTWVSLPGVIYKPVSLTSLVTEWWA